MSDPQFDGPVAVLIALDQSERIVGIADPPPDVVHVPRRIKLSLVPEPVPASSLPPHRQFRLCRALRSSSCRWWRVCNEGRTRTPEDAYVYLEVASP